MGDVCTGRSPGRDCSGGKMAKVAGHLLRVPRAHTPGQAVARVSPVCPLSPGEPWPPGMPVIPGNPTSPCAPFSPKNPLRPGTRDLPCGGSVLSTDEACWRVAASAAPRHGRCFWLRSLPGDDGGRALGFVPPSSVNDSDSFMQWLGRPQSFTVVSYGNSQPGPETTLWAVRDWVTEETK